MENAVKDAFVEGEHVPASVIRKLKRDDAKTLRNIEHDEAMERMEKNRARNERRKAAGIVDEKPVSDEELRRTMSKTDYKYYLAAMREYEAQKRHRGVKRVENENMKPRESDERDG